MKITTAEGAPLMEVTEIRIDNGKVVFEGKMMGGIPMKAYVSPSQMLDLVRMVWFRKACQIVWILITSLFKSEKA